MERKTALYDRHIAAGGKMVPFAGYLLPVQYQKGIIAEHQAVRQAAGLFDVSHMGEFVMRGPDALSNINRLLTNDFWNLAPGGVRYSPMCYETGGTVDDLLVYRLEEDVYYIVVNAANKDKDFEWIKENLTGDAQVALQGPKSADILKEVAKSEMIPEKYYTFVENGEISGLQCLISRTGYTGEDGFELYCESTDAGRLWDLLLEAGEAHGLTPCGLGARDTLRLEAGMPLYGHELSAEITPREAGLGPFVKMEKDAFIGKDALEAPRSRKRIGLRLLDRGIAREGAAVFDDGGNRIGTVTSGTMSPTLSAAIAMALVSADFSGETLFAEVREKKLKAETVNLPFYRANQ